MPTPSGHKTYEEIKATRGFRPWYDALIDYTLANPRATLEEKARHFNSNPSYISVIENSDMFKARRAARRDEVNARVAESIADKAGRVAHKALDLVASKLERKGESIPFQQVADTAFRSLAMLGYGPKANAPAVVNINNGPGAQVVQPVSLNVLEEARAALRRSEEAKRLEAPARIIDVTPLAAEPESSQAVEGPAEKPVDVPVEE